MLYDSCGAQWEGWARETALGCQGLSGQDSTIRPDAW